jgi:hypothetical protein
MVRRQFYIDNVYVGNITKASPKKDIDSSTTQTFDGAIVDTNPNPSVTVSVEAIRAGTIQQYINLEKKLKYSLNNQVTLQIITTDTAKDGNLIVQEFYYNCKLSSDEVEVDPVERAALKIEFIGESYRKVINGEEI